MAMCECSDPGCPCCRGACDGKAALTLFRIDMEDETGTPMCENCADDALESGVFSPADCLDDGDQGEE